MIDPNRLLMKREGKNCANLWCNRSKNVLQQLKQLSGRSNENLNQLSEHGNLTFLFSNLISF